MIMATKISKAQFSMLMWLAEYGEAKLAKGKIVTARALARVGLVIVEASPVPNDHALQQAKLTRAGRDWLRERGAL